MSRLALLALLTLAACGADGAPKAPAARPVPGVTLSGQASAGITIKG